MLRFQDKAIRQINDFSLYDFPHTLCILGPKGSGKHSLVKYIEDKLSVVSEDITQKLTLEFITDASLSVVRKLFVIDANMISIKEQNTILKFLEEPVENIYIVLLANNSACLLDTVSNRCQKVTLATYSKGQLSEFLPDKNINSDILDIANTPGEVLEYSKTSFTEMVEFAYKILNNIHNASYSNCLVLPNKLSYKPGDEGYDVDLFSKVLLFCCKQQALVNHKKYSAYVETSKFISRLSVPHVDKQKLFENYLMLLKQAERESLC